MGARVERERAERYEQAAQAEGISMYRWVREALEAHYRAAVPGGGPRLRAGAALAYATPRMICAPRSAPPGPASGTCRRNNGRRTASGRSGGIRTACRECVPVYSSFLSPNEDNTAVKSKMHAKGTLDSLCFG